MYRLDGVSKCKLPIFTILSDFIDIEISCFKGKAWILLEIWFGPTLFAWSALERINGEAKRRTTERRARRER